MTPLLEKRLKELPWRKKKLSPDYVIPDEILKMDRPVAFYPGAGRDHSLMAKLTGTNAKVIYQDIAYGADIKLLNPAHQPSAAKKEKIAGFVELLNSEGVQVITTALDENSLEEKADLILARGLFGFLLQNNFAEYILANCKQNAFITGYRFDLDMFCLLYDGLERVSAELLRVPKHYTRSELYPLLTRFPELSFWALKGCFRTFTSTSQSQEKFKRSGAGLLDRELESAAPEELDAYFEAMPPKHYPKYLLRHLKEKGVLLPQAI